jgi:hypothetical protein
MAQAALHSQKRPIDRDDPSKGTIEYRSRRTTPYKGYFVTTYYTRDTDCDDCGAYKGQDYKWAKTDIYKSGLLEYLKITETAGFKDWCVLLFTDQHTLDKPINSSIEAGPRREKHETEWNQIISHPNLVLAVVDWPEYAVGPPADGSATIDNAVLRALRLKAFEDYPDATVCLRDADTLFENLVKIRPITEELALWEQTLLREFKAITEKQPQYKLLIASQPTYHRQWHVNPITGANTTGCYAAVTTTFGGIPQWKDGSLWRKCLDYMRKASHILTRSGERVPSDLHAPTYIGKDEQLLSYVVLPELFTAIYFYYMEYIHVEGGPITRSKNTPFADALLKAGYTKYPSPYLDLLGEPHPTTSKGHRKDENEVTETTLLNPNSIAHSLSPETHRLLQIVFEYQIQSTTTAQQKQAAQKGGGRRWRLRRRTRRGRNLRKNWRGQRRTRRS